MSEQTDVGAKPAYFITGTDTEIGKTLTTCAMLHALGQQGLRATGMKPVAAGSELRDGVWRNEDVDSIVEASSMKAAQELVCPYLMREPAAPHIVAALEGVTIDPAHIKHCFVRLRESADAVVVEGVGGFRVPLVEDFDSADLARELALPVVMVVGVRLGCINHALLTAEAIEARGLKLAGWVANVVDLEMRHGIANIEALSARLPAPLLGCIPRLPAALPAAAAAHLDFSSLPAWPDNANSKKRSPSGPAST